MIYNNLNKSTKIKYSYMLIIFLYIALLVISLFLALFDNYYFELGISIIALATLFTMLYIGLNYIYFSDDGDTIILRYYSLNPLFSEPKSIEIPKNSFIKFEIKKSFFGLNKEVTLYQKTKNGIAKYPAVSLSALNDKELERIQSVLEKYV